MEKDYNSRLQEIELSSAAKYPDKTVVLDAKTLNVLIASENPVKIAQRLQSLGNDVVPLFVGPFHRREAAIHHFCHPSDAL